MLQYLQETKEKERSKNDAGNIQYSPGSFSTFQVLSRFFQYFPGSFSTFQVFSVLSRLLEWQGKRFWSKDKMDWASELGGVKGDQVKPNPCQSLLPGDCVQQQQQLGVDCGCSWWISDKKI